MKRLGFTTAVAILFALSAWSGDSAFAQSTAEQQNELKAQIERRFDVVPLRGSVLLKPKDERGYRSIDLTDAAIAIDGAVATGPELRDKLGDDEISSYGCRTSNPRPDDGCSNPPSRHRRACPRLRHFQSSVTGDSGGASATAAIDSGLAATSSSVPMRSLTAMWSPWADRSQWTDGSEAMPWPSAEASNSGRTRT